MLKKGGVKQSQILIIVYGFKNECLAMKLDLLRSFPKIKVVMADIQHPDFSFINFSRKNAQTHLSDYLRAWIGSKLKKYVWLDSDMLVQNSLKALVKINKFTSKIMMTRESSSIVRGDKKPPQFYFESYNWYFGTKTPFLTDEKSKPFTMCCGVISVDKNYASEWKKYYLLIEKNPPTTLNKSNTPLLNERHDLGMLIWNLIFWKHHGVELDNRYNSVYIKKEKDALIVHYSRDGKNKMLKEAIKLGYL